MQWEGRRLLNYHYVPMIVNIIVKVPEFFEVSCAGNVLLSHFFMEVAG